MAELLPSGRQSTFANRTAWANVFLQRAGLIKVMERGIYELTLEGAQVLAQKPQRIDMKFLERFPSYSEWRKRSAAQKEDGPSAEGQSHANEQVSTNPEEQIERSHRELIATVETDVLDRLRSVAPSQFEQVIVDLLVAMGYGGGRAEMAKAVGRSGDNGIDGVVQEDKLDLDVVYMQAKRYAAAHPVGPSEVRDFIGALEGHRASKGVFASRRTDKGTWPDESTPGKTGPPLQGQSRSAKAGYRLRYVVNRFRLPILAYHVSGQAAGRAQSDAGHRASEPSIWRQTGWCCRRLPWNC
jgi:restriction system protein